MSKLSTVWYACKPFQIPKYSILFILIIRNKKKSGLNMKFRTGRRTSESAVKNVINHPPHFLHTTTTKSTFYKSNQRQRKF